MAARIGGGLVGSLIAEGVKAAIGSGPKPWPEISLNAISNCGVQNKKNFPSSQTVRMYLKTTVMRISCRI